MIKRAMKMGRTEQEERLYIEKPSTSLRSKAAHFVSDLTTVILNPISDKPSSVPPSPTSEDVISEPRIYQQHSDSEDKPPELVYGPDTSSFTAFLYSFLSPGRLGGESDFVVVSNENQMVANNKSNAPFPNVSTKESSGKKGLLSRGRQSLGRAISLAGRFGGYRSHSSGKVNSELKINGGNGEMSESRTDEGIPVKSLNEPLALDILPEISEPSQLMTENTRASLYLALPSLSQGKKWVLLYSTWRHGMSLSTLYRRSNLCPGLSLLVVGDRKGAVFGGLVEAPLRPTTKKKYQGTNNTFVFTNISGHPVIFRPTGVNRYFTLCSTEYLALGGGSHFALYIDGDLLNGSSLASETYGNSCLACTEEFEVKEIELWGFVYASKYEEMLSLLRTEAPGICRF